MDRIWYNGNFYTGDNAYPQCSAIYAKDGVIMALGEDAEIRKLAKERNAEETDLQGKVVFPGFIESHMHLLEYAMQDSCIHLEEAKSFDDVAALCAERVSWAKEKGKWVQAIGFNQNDWDQKVLPTREDLDRISTEVPVTIRRACLHVSVCNTPALKAIGLLDGEAPDNCDRCEDGTLNGIIREDAQGLISKALPVPTKDDIKDLILRGCENAASRGIVEIQTDDFHSVPEGHEETVVEAFKELAEEDMLPVRIYEQCYLANEEGLTKFLQAGHYTGEAYGMFRVGPLKVVMDGSLGSHSAYMRKPYANDPQTKGISYYDREELYRYMKKAHQVGMQIAVHCIGDAALEDVLDVYEQIQWETPRTDTRHGIVHCQIMDDEQLERFRKMNLIGYVQPIFVRCDMNIVDQCVGEELAKQSYNWRRFLDRGVHLSGGSDCPVEKFDVLPNIQYAVTRKNPETGKAWYPENAVSREEAAAMFTREGAYASFAENVRGTLTVGKEADMVVLSESIFDVPEEKIGEIQVLETVVKGKSVYKR